MASYTREEQTKLAARFVIVPRYSIAVPVAQHTEETLARFLSDKGDMQLPTSLEEYPIVSHSVLKTHFPSFEILPVLQTVSVYKPLATFSGWEKQIRERQLRVARENEQRAKRIHKIKSSPFFRGDEDLVDIDS